MATATEDDGEQLCELMLTAAVPVRQCAAELSRSELASKVWLEMGRVHSTVPLGKVAELATTLDLAERVYAVVGVWKPAALPDAAPTGELLPLFKALVAAADHWAVAVAAWSRVHSGRAPATVRVVGKRAGSRYAALPSMELAGSLGAAIAIQLGVVVDLRSPDLEVTASLNDKGLLLSLALLRRPDSLEGRLPCRGLHPHVAWAMARCVLPLPPGAVLLDPMCGTAALPSRPDPPSSSSPNPCPNLSPNPSPNPNPNPNQVRRGDATLRGPSFSRRCRRLAPRAGLRCERRSAAAGRRQPRRAAHRPRTAAAAAAR